MAGRLLESLGLSSSLKDPAARIDDESKMSCPADLFCPIGYTIMKDPVSLTIHADGCVLIHTYDRCNIEPWLAKNAIDPISKLPLTDKTLRPNGLIKKRIEEFQKHKRIVVSGTLEEKEQLLKQLVPSLTETEVTLDQREGQLKETREWIKDLAKELKASTDTLQKAQQAIKERDEVISQLQEMQKQLQQALERSNQSRARLAGSLRKSDEALRETREQLEAAKEAIKASKEADDELDELISSVSTPRLIHTSFFDTERDSKKMLTVPVRVEEDVASPPVGALVDPPGGSEEERGSSRVCSLSSWFPSCVRR